MDAEVGKKRAVEAESITVETVQDVCRWLESVIAAGGLGAVTDEQRSHMLHVTNEQQIDGEVLKTLTESDLQEMMGVRIFGQRRKLRERIRELMAGGQAMKSNSGTVMQATILISPQPAGPASAQKASTDSNQPSCMSAPSSVVKVLHREDAGAAIPVDAATAIQVNGAQSTQGSNSGNDAAGGAQIGLNQGAEDIKLRMADEAKGCNLELTDEVRKKMQAEEFCVNTCQWATKKLREFLTTGSRNGVRIDTWAPSSPSNIKKGWLDDLEQVSKKLVLPRSSIVAVGDTGAGKSSLLNAILNETGILPTNGMRACTAVIIELSHDSSMEGPNYTAEVEFVTNEEWDQELDSLLDDLTQQDGRAILMVPDSSAMNYPSWCKLFSVYGDDYTHSRVQERAGTYKNMMVADLKRKLQSCRRITHALGTIKREQSNDARDFRRRLEKYMDSSNDQAGGQYWPIVKRVRVKSRKWKALSSGTILVDAPGVRDDNTARDKVVKQYLQEADGVWIVANIKRAVNDKTAKDMLGESFRRQLFMDGQYGQLAFIATQSDVLVRSEIAKSLRMQDGATNRDCALARNKYTVERIQNDFYAGLEEMHRMAGEPMDAAACRARFRLPVFCVSAVEYQKLAGVRRGDDGGPQVFADTEETQVPALQRFMHENTLARRFRNVRRAAEGLSFFCDSLESYLQDDGTQQRTGEARARNKSSFARHTAGLSATLGKHVEALDRELAQQFEEVIKPQLREGAGTATNECLVTARGWGQSQSSGGLHWATYKATTRRYGEFRINMNEALSEPIFRAVSTHWERVLVSQLARELDRLAMACSSTIASAVTDIGTALADGGVQTSQLQCIQVSVEQRVRANLARAAEEARQAVQKQQKELTRSITPQVQSTMMDGYTRGNEQTGTGSHRRRCEVIESHVNAHKGAMFLHAVEPVLAGLGSMRKAAVAAMRSEVSKLEGALGVQYSVFWDEAASTPEAIRARKALLGMVSSPFFEAREALRKLLRAHGEAPAEDPVGDEELEVMPVAQPEVVVSLLDDDASGSAACSSAGPPAAAGGGGGGGGGRVRSHVSGGASADGCGDGQGGAPPAVPLRVKNEPAV